LKVIGGKKNTIGGSVNGKVVWEMEELGNAFRFYLPNFPDTELFIEYDEISAAGEAYEDLSPLNMLDILKKLEQLAPNFHGVKVSKDILLIRKRLALSRGLTMSRAGKNEFFLKDNTLTTINFLDFHQQYLTNITPE
jgi:hypothetical protein